MKKWLVFAAIFVGYLAVSTNAFAQDDPPPVEYLKVCSLYGEGFYYIPGTDICRKVENGDSRRQTAYGTMRSIVPYPKGKWVTNVQTECPGNLVNIGSFKSTDFTSEVEDPKFMGTPPVTLHVPTTQFISKLIMSGGFFDPRLPARHGVNGAQGLCLRSIDNVAETNGNGAFIMPPDGDGGIAIGCIANSRIVNMPASYSISATAAYPNIDIYFDDASEDVGGPYVYGAKLIVTTDVDYQTQPWLTYTDAGNVVHPAAGSLNVWACIEPKNGQGNQGSNN